MPKLLLLYSSDRKELVDTLKGVISKWDLDINISTRELNAEQHPFHHALSETAESDIAFLFMGRELCNAGYELEDLAEIRNEVFRKKTGWGYVKLDDAYKYGFFPLTTGIYGTAYKERQSIEDILRDILRKTMPFFTPEEAFRFLRSIDVGCHRHFAEFYIDFGNTNLCPRYLDSKE